MATKKIAKKKAVPAKGTNWATAPGPKGINKKKQKALMVGFLTTVTNKHFSDNTIPLLNYAQQGQPVLKAATIVDGKPVDVTLSPGQDYIDLKYVYRRLAPLTTDQVNSLFILARSNSASFTAMASNYWDQGASVGPYPHGDENCPPAVDTLALNK